LRSELSGTEYKILLTEIKMNESEYENSQLELLEKEKYGFLKKLFK
jgi:hypothetical protein